MIRRLGVLVVVAGAALLAGCAGPGGMTPDEAVVKHDLLRTLQAPPHACGEYWAGKASELYQKLDAENRLPGPVPGLQPSNRGWANRVDTEQGLAIRASLLRLHETLSRALQAGTAVMEPPPPPPVPSQVVTPQQIAIAVLALEVEDLFEADHFSGHHQAPSGQPWMGPTPPPVNQTSGLPFAPPDLLRVLKEALDM